MKNLLSIHQSSLSKAFFFVICFTTIISPSLSLFAGLGLTVVLIVMTLIPFIWLVHQRDIKHNYTKPEISLTILFLVYCLITTLWSPDTEQSFILWVRIFLITISAFLCLYSTDKLNYKQCETIVQLLIFATTFACLFSAIEMLSNGTITTFFKHLKDKNWEFQSSYLNRGMVFFSIIIWPVISYLLLTNKKLWAITLLFVVSLNIFLLSSTSAKFAIIFGSSAFLLTYLFGKNIIKVIQFLALIAVIIIPVMSLNISPETLSKVLPNLKDTSQEYRLHMWHFSAKKSMDNPILGHGLDSSRHIEFSENDMIRNIHEQPLPPISIHPHNYEIQIFLELGIIGLLFYISLILALLERIYKLETSKEIKAGFVALITSYFIIGQFAFSIWQNWWIAAGVIATFYMLVTNKSSQDRKVL